MIYFLLIIVGTVLGSLLIKSIEGFIAGGFLGWLTALIFQLKSQLKSQQLLISNLSLELRKILEQSRLPAKSSAAQEQRSASDMTSSGIRKAEDNHDSSVNDVAGITDPASPDAPSEDGHALGLDLQADTLPDDVASLAHQLWQEAEPAQAVTLLYRASLSRLHHYGHMPVSSSAAESDFVNWVENNCDEVLYHYFQQLTSVWQAVSYAHQMPDSSLFNTLCNQWYQRFDAPLEAAKTRQTQSQVAPDRLTASAATVHRQPVTADSVSGGQSTSKLRSSLVKPIGELFNLLKAQAIGFFSGGNLLVKAGVLILFFGVAFLLKYAAERAVIPVEIRYTGIMSGAVVMLLLGWRLRRTKLQYALVLQGGAVGVLYLVVFAAYQLHGLLAPITAMGLLLMIVTLAAAIAILQHAKWLAAIAVTGGFLAPLLASSGSGSHTALFSYYLVLNLSIALIAFYRSWRLLNWLGFLFTFGIATFWGVSYYKAEFFHSTEPFLIGFLLIYILIPFLYANRQPPELKGLVDGTLIFGTPVAFMGLQSQLADGYSSIPHLMAYSSAALGAIYLMLASLIRRKRALLLLCECYLALAIAFLTLAVPLGFDGRVTSSSWAIEGAALIWVGFRQQRVLPRLSGLALILLAAFFYLQSADGFYLQSADGFYLQSADGFYLQSADGSVQNTFLLNADFMGSLLLALASLFAARLYAQHQTLVIKPEKTAALVLLVWGFGWWFGGGMQEINRHFNGLEALLGYQIMVAFTCGLGWLAAMRLQSLPLFGLSLFSASTGLLLLLDLYRYGIEQSMWFNLNFASALILAGLLLWMAVICWQRKFPEGFALGILAQHTLVWTGVVVLLAFGYLEMQHFQPPGFNHSLYLLYAVLLLMLFIPVHQRLNMPQLTQPLLLLLPLLSGTLLTFAGQDYHLTAWLGWLIFPLAVLALLFSLRYLERATASDSENPVRYPLGYFHLATVLVLTFALAWQLGKLFHPQRPEGSFSGGSHWVTAVWGLSFAVVLVGLYKLRQVIWPLRRYPFELSVLLPRILLGLLSCWLLLSNLRQPGELTIVLAYIPIVNPIDLVNLLVLMLISLWLNRIDRNFLSIQPQLRLIIPAILAFIWANAALLRGFHYLLDIPFRFEPMFASFAVESGLSILWSTIALLTMVVANRRGWRTIWMVGGILMGVVVVKLFTVDMTGTGTIARIIGFITVGALLLLVGYLAPVPPKNSARPEPEDDKSPPHWSADSDEDSPPASALDKIDGNQRASSS